MLALGGGPQPVMLEPAQLRHPWVLWALTAHQGTCLGLGTPALGHPPRHPPSPASMLAPGDDSGDLPLVPSLSDAPRGLWRP